MSLYDYKASLQITAAHYPFYALIMAAMRQADTDNSEKLEQAFPEVRAELLTWYNCHRNYHWNPFITEKELPKDDVELLRKEKS